MTPTALSEFRSRLPDCELAVYADTASRLVLGADGALRYPQEYLDALCACAADLFSDDAAFGAHPVHHVVFLTPTGSRAFFRSASEPDEALCCICGPGVDFAALLAEGRAALDAGGPGA